MADEHPGGASDDQPAGEDDELASRLADIHRRSAELAERVASFRTEVEPLVNDTGQGADEQSPADTDGGAEGAAAEQAPQPVAEQPDQPAEPADVERPRQPERRHRPRPSASAPLVYDDDGNPPAPGAEAESEAEPGRQQPAAESSASASADTPSETSADTPSETSADTPADAPAQEPADKPADKPDDKPSDEDQPKEKRQRRGLPGWARKARTLIITVAIIVAAALALRAYVVEPFYVPSASMEPTLHGCNNCNNDHVLVQKVSYYFHDPRRGDVVVFDKPAHWNVPDSELIKRVIGVAGDKVVLRGGKVYVNGAKLDESYVNKKCKHGTRPETGKNTWKVPKDRLFVMGDNRCDSDDSRTFGMVPLDNVVGEAFLIYWPVKDFGSP